MANIKLFESKKIHSVWNEEEQKWYFAVVDVIEALTDSDKPRDYWYRLKRREKELSGIQLSTFCRQLKIGSSDGKKYNTECSDVEGPLRIIQSIPSQKAEPFKRWLAQVGYQRLEEIENPELAQHRMKEIYKAKGFSDEWIERRVRGIAVRDELTKEWKKRGIKEGLECAILTSEISKATFGLTPSDYKKFKALTKPQENLRDHMTDLELIFTMLGEASTTEIARTKDAQGFNENKNAAKERGSVAGRARKALEKKSGRKVVTKENYNVLTEKQKRQIKRGNKK